MERFIEPEYDDYIADRFMFTFFHCENLYFDRATASYICASSGKSFTKTRHCKTCPHLKVINTVESKIDLRDYNA